MICPRTKFIVQYVTGEKTLRAQEAEEYVSATPQRKNTFDQHMKTDFPFVFLPHEFSLYSQAHTEIHQNALIIIQIICQLYVIAMAILFVNFSYQAH